MITFKIKGKEYQIPDKATEVTISQYIRLSDTKDIQEQIRILADLPDGVALDETSLATLAYLTEYFVNGLELPETDLKPLDLTEQPFGTWHYCNQAILKTKHDAVILMLCYIYAGEDWSNTKRPKLHEKYFDEMCKLPAWQYLPLVEDYVKQLEEMKKTWNRQLSSTPTAEQQQAGIDKLNKFGMRGTLLNMAGKDLEKYDRLHNREWYDILLYLMQEKEENEFQKRYQKIISKKR